MLSFGKFVKKYIKEDGGIVRRHGAIFRGNPPTRMHIAFGRHIADQAAQEGADHVVYATRTQDAKKNPLSPEQKIRYLRAASPDVNWQLTPQNAPTILGILSQWHKEGVTHPVLHGDDERSEQFRALVNNYNGKEGPHGYYNFPEGIDVRQFGAARTDPSQPSPKLDDTEVSGTGARNAALTGNREAFHAMAPQGLSPEMKDQMMVDTLHGMHPPQQEVAPKAKAKPKKVK